MSKITKLLIFLENLKNSFSYTVFSHALDQRFKNKYYDYFLYKKKKFWINTQIITDIISNKLLELVLLGI